MFTDFTDFVLTIASRDPAQMSRLLYANPEIKAACEAVVDSIPPDITKPAPSHLDEITAGQFVLFDNWNGKDTGKGQRHKLQVKLWTTERIIWKRPAFQGNAALWSVSDPKDLKATKKTIAKLDAAGKIVASEDDVDFLIQTYDAEFIGVIKCGPPGSYYQSKHWIVMNLTKKRCVVVVSVGNSLWGLELGPEMWDYKDGNGKVLGDNAIWSIRHAALDSLLVSWGTGTGKQVLSAG